MMLTRPGTRMMIWALSPNELKYALFRLRTIIDMYVVLLGECIVKLLCSGKLNVFQLDFFSLHFIGFEVVFTNTMNKLQSQNHRYFKFDSETLCDSESLWLLMPYFCVTTEPHNKCLHHTDTARPADDQLWSLVGRHGGAQSQVSYYNLETIEPYEEVF